MDRDKITRSVDLTSEQVTELRTYYRELGHVPKLLCDLLLQIATESAYREKEFWQQVHAIANTTPGNERISIAWIEKKIHVYGNPEAT